MFYDDLPITRDRLRDRLSKVPHRHRQHEKCSESFRDFLVLRCRGGQNDAGNLNFWDFEF